MLRVFWEAPPGDVMSVPPPSWSATSAPWRPTSTATARGTRCTCPGPPSPRASPSPRGCATAPVWCSRRGTRRPSPSGPRSCPSARRPSRRAGHSARRTWTVTAAGRSPSRSPRVVPPRSSASTDPIPPLHPTAGLWSASPWKPPGTRGTRSTASRRVRRCSRRTGPSLISIGRHWATCLVEEGGRFLAAATALRTEEDPDLYDVHTTVFRVDGASLEVVMSE
jgi:hypothetical protein